MLRWWAKNANDVFSWKLVIAQRKRKSCGKRDINCYKNVRQIFSRCPKLATNANTLFANDIFPGTRKEYIGTAAHNLGSWKLNSAVTVDSTHHDLLLMLFYTAEVISKRYVISTNAQSITAYHTVSCKLIPTYGVIIIKFEVRSNIFTSSVQSRTIRLSNCEILGNLSASKRLCEAPEILLFC